MLKIKTIIIEDDIDACLYLSSILTENFKQLEILGNASDVKSSVELIQRIQPDLIFMDIMLKRGDAFQILSQFDGYSFEVIFVTAYNNYLEKAFQHYAFNYILKPIDLQKIEPILERYLHMRGKDNSSSNFRALIDFIKNKNDKILLHTGKERVFVSINKIVKCIADGNYTYFYTTDNKKTLVSKPLKYYNQLLMPKGFFRAHRSILVNISYIKSIYKREALILRNKEKILISQKNKVNLIQLIELLS